MKYRVIKGGKELVRKVESCAVDIYRVSCIMVERFLASVVPQTFWDLMRKSLKKLTFKINNEEEGD